MVKSESIVKIAAALLKAQSEMGDATKDAKNPFYKSSFADLNAIREASMPVLNANKISVLQATVPVTNLGTGNNEEYVETILLHESGEYIASQTKIVCAKQNDPQAYGSAVSYARRYGLQALVCIGAVDDDSEKAMGRGNMSANVSIGKVLTTTGGVNTPKGTIPVKDKTNDLDVALASKEPAKVETVTPKAAEVKPARKFARSQTTTATQKSSGDLF